MKNTNTIQSFLQRKNVVLSAKRYGIDALGAMAQGLFCSLLIGTIVKTIGQQFGIALFITIGQFASDMSGAAMAIAIGYALQAPPLVLFSLSAVGYASNQCGGAGGPLAVLLIAIISAALSYSELLAERMITGSFFVRGSARSFFSTLRPSSSGSIRSSSTSSGI